MFDLSWAEMAVLVVVALIFIGPKDLPVAMKAISRGIRAMRSLASEFQHHLDEMVQQADLSETRDQLKNLKKLNLRDQVGRIVDPDRTLRDGLELKGEAAQGLPRAPAPPPPPSLSNYPVRKGEAAPSQGAAAQTTGQLAKPDIGTDSAPAEGFLSGKSAEWANAPEGMPSDTAGRGATGVGEVGRAEENEVQAERQTGEASGSAPKPELNPEEQALAMAPPMLPPRTALRLIKEAPYWHRPSVLPPEVALHNGVRVVIVSETLEESVAVTRPEVAASHLAQATCQTTYQNTQQTSQTGSPHG